MTDSFWFLGPEEPEGDAERLTEAGVSFDARESYAPFQESMRGDRRHTRNPSTDQRKVRRQIHRSGAHALEEVNWDEIYPQLKDHADDGELHRGIGVILPDKLHDFVHDESKPVHERAHALLDHVSGSEGSRGKYDYRTGLGMHWSLRQNVAEDSAEGSAGHLAEVSAGDESKHDFKYGRTPGEIDEGGLTEHLHEHHGIHPDEQPYDNDEAFRHHQQLHQGPAPMAGQEALFPAPSRDPKAVHHITEEYMESDEPHSRPATEVVLHMPIPDRDDIEEDVHGHNYARGGDIYHPFGHGEAEVPLRVGASIPISGVSWKKKHHWEYEPERDEWPEYVHHRFSEKDMPYKEARKQATVLPTSVERLNKDDQIRTPTGQMATVKGIRPHESDSRMIYLDTDQGTSSVKRGTEIQIVPRNSQQQELPDSGNPTGNTGAMPGQGMGSGGGGGQQSVNQTCPNCGQNALNLRGGTYQCQVCGYTVQATNTPGGLPFGDKPMGAMPGERKPGEVPTARVWASMLSGENAIARRARQVAGGDQ